MDGKYIMEHKITEYAIKAITCVLDDFISDCIDEHGNPKAPSRKMLMSTRGCLPAWCKNTLIKEKK